MQQVDAVADRACRLDDYSIGQVAFVEVGVQAVNQPGRIVQSVFRVGVQLPDQGRQFAGYAVDSHVTGQSDLVIGADGFDDLRESAPGFFGHLKVIAFVQAALNV